MNKIEPINIRKLMFKGNDPEKRCVGLAEWRIKNQGIITYVKIDYTWKSGGELYPYILYMATSEVAKYPKEYLPDGKTIIYVVPIKDFKVVDPTISNVQLGV